MGKRTVLLDDIKAMRAELAEDYDENAAEYAYDGDPYDNFHAGIKKCLDAIDKLIAENEK